MPTRTAHTIWSGGLQDGTGTVQLTSSGIGSYEVSFPRRAADEAGGVTSPEELLAASHSACGCSRTASIASCRFGSQFSASKHRKMSMPA